MLPFPLQRASTTLAVAFAGEPSGRSEEGRSGGLARFVVLLCLPDGFRFL